MHKAILTLVLFSTYTFATLNTTVPSVGSVGSDLKITIYNDNRAFVSEKRQVIIPTGKQNIVYEGVPSSVITQSVIPTFTGVDTSLYSQNYIYNLISLSSMLKNSIDKKVNFYINGINPRYSKGILLSSSPVMIKEDGTGNIHTLEKATQVIFDKVPEEMITKPSLVWNIDALSSGNLKIDLKYLTTGISWKSDYVLGLGKNTFDLTGWITVDNQSGVVYEKAEITCLAGEVNKVRREHVTLDMVMYKAKNTKRMSSPGVKEESFSGYHIYKIPFRETIKNKEQKQISFLNKGGIEYSQYGVASNHSFGDYGERKLIFKNTIAFKNTRKNKLGLALPEGTVRMYKKDKSGNTHFIGEQRINNIPEDENVTLSIGTLFDVVGEKVVTKFRVKDHYRFVETTYNIRNQGKEERVLKIKEVLPVSGESVIIKSTCSGKCTEKRINAFTREFSVILRGKEKYIFTSEFESHF